MENPEQHGGDFFTSIIAENESDDAAYIDLIKAHISNQGDIEKYDVTSQSDGRYLASSLEGGASRYFSMRKDKGGNLFVHDDDGADY